MKGLVLAAIVLLGTGCFKNVMKKDPGTLEAECKKPENAGASMCRWLISKAREAQQGKAETAKIMKDSSDLFAWAYRCGIVQEKLTGINSNLRERLMTCAEELELRENDK